MTDAQLDRIEAELRLTLPADYRATSKQFPFRRIGNEDVYWFYDNPDAVIQNTRYPMIDGNYDIANWKPTYVIIGRGAAGDEHLIDTALVDSPVYLLSHEDRSIVEEWPSMAAFVDYWEHEYELAERAEAERARQRKMEAQQTRRGAAILFVFLLICFALIALIIHLPHSTRSSRRAQQNTSSPRSSP